MIATEMSGRLVPGLQFFQRYLPQDGRLWSNQTRNTSESGGGKLALLPGTGVAYANDAFATLEV